MASSSGGGLERSLLSFRFGHMQYSRSCIGFKFSHLTLLDGTEQCDVIRPQQIMYVSCRVDARLGGLLSLR